MPHDIATYQAEGKPDAATKESSRLERAGKQGRGGRQRGEEDEDDDDG